MTATTWEVRCLCEREFVEALTRRLEENGFIVEGTGAEFRHGEKFRRALFACAPCDLTAELMRYEPDLGCVRGRHAYRVEAKAGTGEGYDAVTYEADCYIAGRNLLRAGFKIFAVFGNWQAQWLDRLQYKSILVDPSKYKCREEADAVVRFYREQLPLAPVREKSLRGSRTPALQIPKSCLVDFDKFVAELPAPAGAA